MQNIYLTKEEKQALALLSDGIGTGIVRRKLDIPRQRWDVFTLNLRRKTGIADHKDERQCLEYIRQYEAAPMQLSPDEVSISRRLIDGETMEGAAYMLKIPIESASAILESACANAGIFTKDKRARLMQLRTFLSIHHSRNGKPVTDTELKALRLVAKGIRPEYVYLELGGNEKYFVDLLRNVCLRLGINAKGRGARLQLIRGYLERLDAENEPVTMDDPAF